MYGYLGKVNNPVKVTCYDLANKTKQVRYIKDYVYTPVLRNPHR